MLSVGRVFPWQVQDFTESEWAAHVAHVQTVLAAQEGGE